MMAFIVTRNDVMHHCMTSVKSVCNAHAVIMAATTERYCQRSCCVRLGYPLRLKREQLNVFLSGRDISAVHVMRHCTHELLEASSAHFLPQVLHVTRPSSLHLWRFGLAMPD